MPRIVVSGYSLDLGPQWLTAAPNRCEDGARIGFIKPEPSQILTLFKDSDPQNIDLDNGAWVSIAKSSYVKEKGFKIYPNNQTALLADDKTRASSLGEIHKIFTRNNVSCTYDTIILKDLLTDLIGGNTFIIGNDIVQDQPRKQISIKRKHVFQETNRHAPRPTSPGNHLAKLAHVRVLLPGQSLEAKVPFSNGTEVAVEPHFQNKDFSFPEPQICTVQNNRLIWTNTTNFPINVKKNTKMVHVRTISSEDIDKVEKNCVFEKTNERKLEDNTNQIHHQRNEQNQAINNKLDVLHEKYKNVFNKDLSQGYNGFAGPHLCKLLLADESRPTSKWERSKSYRRLN